MGLLKAPENQYAPKATSKQPVDVCIAHQCPKAKEAGDLCGFHHTLYEDSQSPPGPGPVRRRFS